MLRSRNQVMLGGVCGGLGDFLGVNPAIIRLFFVLLVFGNGIGAFLYLLLWVTLPLNGQVPKQALVSSLDGGQADLTYKTNLSGDDYHRMLAYPQTQLGILVGAMLIVLGLFYLLPYLDWPTWIDFDLLWPILLIFGGLALLIRRPRGE